MNISIRKVPPYINILIGVQSETLDLGLHDKEEAMALLKEIENVAEELKYHIEKWN